MSSPCEFILVDPSLHHGLTSCQPQLSHSSHWSIYLFSWCICHPDGHMKSCKPWFNFTTTLLASSHYIAQWILMSLLCLCKPNQILKPALPSLTLPYHASNFPYPILVSLTSSLPSVHHIHFLRSLLLFPFLKIIISYSLSLLKSKLCLPFQTSYIIHILHKTVPKTLAPH